MKKENCCVCGKPVLVLPENFAGHDRQVIDGKYYCQACAFKKHLKDRKNKIKE